MAAERESAPNAAIEPRVTPGSQVRARPAVVTPWAWYLASPTRTVVRTTSVAAVTPGVLRTASAASDGTPGPCAPSTQVARVPSRAWARAASPRVGWTKRTVQVMPMSRVRG